MEQKGFMEPDPQNRQPPNYNTISANPLTSLDDKPPPTSTSHWICSANNCDSTIKYSK